jgi:hypothetical protein
MRLLIVDDENAVLFLPDNHQQRAETTDTNTISPTNR